MTPGKKTLLILARAGMELSWRYPWVGFLMLLILFGYSVWKNRAIREPLANFSWREVGAAVREAAWEIPLPIVVLGGITGLGIVGLASSLGAGMQDIISGWLIEDGKLTAPIKDINLIGNGPKVLADIDMLGNDFAMGSPGTCGKDGQGVPVGDGQPTLRVKSLTVGGTKGTYR